MKFTFSETQKIPSKKDPSTYSSSWIKEISIDTETNELIAHTHNQKAFDLLSQRLHAYYNLQGIKGVQDLKFSTVLGEKKFSIIFKNNITGSLKFLEAFKAISKKTFNEIINELNINSKKPSTTILSRTPT